MSLQAVAGSNYGTLGAPNPQEMQESRSNAHKWTYSSVQVGKYAISTDKIHAMRASDCCLCCCGCYSTLEIEYLDPATKQNWTEKFRFCCDDTAAINTLTKINAYLGGKTL